MTFIYDICYSPSSGRPANTSFFRSWSSPGDFSRTYVFYDKYCDFINVIMQKRFNLSHIALANSGTLKF